jgi:hypothetical protein
MKFNVTNERTQAEVAGTKAKRIVHHREHRGHRGNQNAFLCALCGEQSRAFFILLHIANFLGEDQNPGTRSLFERRVFIIDRRVPTSDVGGFDALASAVEIERHRVVGADEFDVSIGLDFGLHA